MYNHPTYHKFQALKYKFISVPTGPVDIQHNSNYHLVGIDLAQCKWLGNNNIQKLIKVPISLMLLFCVSSCIFTVISTRRMFNNQCTLQPNCYFVLRFTEPKPYDENANIGNFILCFATKHSKDMSEKLCLTKLWI